MDVWPFFVGLRVLPDTQEQVTEFVVRAQRTIDRRTNSVKRPVR